MRARVVQIDSTAKELLSYATQWASALETYSTTMAATQLSGTAPPPWILLQIGI